MKTRLVLTALLSLVAGASAGFLLALESNGVTLKRGAMEASRMLDTEILDARLLTLYKHERVPNDVPPPPAHAYDWLGTERFLPIAHALGPMLWGGPNAGPTFEEARRRGFRLFEVDLAVTTDHRLVCFHGHDEREVNEMSWTEYFEKTRAQGLEPLEFAQLVAWASADPQIHFILDVKNHFDEAYRLARMQIESPALGQSFIPQIYHFDQLPQFRSDNFFAGEIFTSYASGFTTSHIVETAERLHIHVVTLTLLRVGQLRSMPSSIAFLAHPVDDPFEAARLRTLGLRGVYTSYVTPESAPEVFASWPDGCRPGSQWRQCRFVPSAVGQRTVEQP